LGKATFLTGEWLLPVGRGGRRRFDQDQVLVIIGGYPFLGIGTGEQVEQLSGKERLSSVEFINRIALLIFLIENAVGINILPFDGKLLFCDP